MEIFGLALGGCDVSRLFSGLHTVALVALALLHCREEMIDNRVWGGSFADSNADIESDPRYAGLDIPDAWNPERLGGLWKNRTPVPARTAAWGEHFMIRGISLKGVSNLSCSTYAGRSDRLSVCITICNASPTGSRRHSFLVRCAMNAGFQVFPPSSE